MKSRTFSQILASEEKATSNRKTEVTKTGGKKDSFFLTNTINSEHNQVKLASVMYQ